MPAEERDDSSPGWDAITRAFERLYPGQEPAHFGTLLSFRLGGGDPLDGISAYRAGGFTDADAVPPHWHVVSYGMSELYAKESDDPEHSGWGFEFTFRLTRDATEQQPPGWALNFLQNLARYVFNTGNVFEPGHHIDLNGPIALDQETQIRAVLFAADPQLQEIDTSHGKVSFVQVVGTTPDELAAARAWDTTRFLEVMARRDPLFVTDLRRPSCLLDPAVAGEVRRRTADEGSSTDMIFVGNLQWARDGTEVEITLGASAVDQFRMLLTGRLPFGRRFIVRGSGPPVVFKPGDPARTEVAEPEVLTVSLPATVARSLADRVKAKRGVYPVAPGIRLRVVPSQIKDADGNVVQVIGE